MKGKYKSQSNLLKNLKDDDNYCSGEENSLNETKKIKVDIEKTINVKPKSKVNNLKKYAVASSSDDNED